MAKNKKKKVYSISVLFDNGKRNFYKNIKKIDRFDPDFYIVKFKDSKTEIGLKRNRVVSISVFEDKNK